MSSAPEEENVRVVVRIRPMQTMEKKNGDISCVKATADGKEVQVKVGPLDAQVYKCNQCFPCDTTQALFFAESGITDLLDSAIQGYRACAFAFGQTGAGKTFTMMGPSKGIHHKDKQVGMIARSLEYVFMRLNSMNVQYNVKIACTEIYHENVYDLFADERERVSLPVREHSTDGFFLEGCKMVECSDYEVACAALDVAMRSRIVGGHDLNSRSSRSHCLTEIYIEIPSAKPNTASNLIDEVEGGAAGGGEGQFITRGRMSLVDLAGSERLKSTNSTGKVLHEAGFINRSLYVLGKVIAGLVRTNGDLNHKDVPYRDSKLTKLLISSLGGRCHTLLISCVSEAKGSQNETLRTLKFSMSCARIRNKPVKFLDPQDRLILDLREEIRRLQTENKKLRSTILTAPAHLVASEDELSGVMGGGASGGLNNSGQKKQQSTQLPVVHTQQHQHRALSAHSSLSPQHKKNRQAAARNVRLRGGVAGGGVGMRGSPAKKQLIAANRMKKSHSDFVAQLGKRRDTRNIEKALRGMEYDHHSTSSLLYPSGATGAASSSILDSRIVEASDEDTHSHASLRSGNNSYQNSSSQRAQYTSQDEADEESSYDSVMSAARKKMNPTQLEDLVRRRASGPMVFKTNEPLGPVRQTHAPAMNNYEKAMEASRLEKLEKRIAKMEKMEARRRKEQELASAAAASDSHHHHVTLDKYLSVHEGGDSPHRGPAAAAAAGRVVDHSDVDESSVASAAGAAGGESVSAAAIVAAAAAGSPKKRKVAKKKAAPAPAKDSPYLAHLSNKPKPAKQAKSKPSGAPSEGIAAAAAAAAAVSSANVSSTASIDSHHSQLQDAILAELEEYGLGPTTHEPTVPPPAANKVTKKAAGLPSIKTESAAKGGAKKSKPAPAQSIKLPELISKPQQQQQQQASPKKQHVPITRFASPKKKKSQNPVDVEPPYSPPANFNRMQSNGKLISPEVEAVKSKLAVLERSLTAKQMEFEDNPGEVTREAEEQLVALKQEAREMRKELEIVAGNYDYEEDEFEAEEAEGEGAATADEGTASGGRSEKFDGYSPASNKPPPINITASGGGHGLSSGSGSYPPTPQAVKDVAFDIQALNASPLGGGSSSSTKKRVKTPVAAKTPIKTGDDEYGEEEEDGYGDADFEADDEEEVKPTAAAAVAAAASVKTPQLQQPSVKLTIDTTTTPTSTNQAYSNNSSANYQTSNNTNVNNQFREPASTVSIASNEVVYPYNPSPLVKSEQPSTHTSDNSNSGKNSTVAGGYSPSSKPSQQQQLQKQSSTTTSKKVLPPAKPVESDDDDNYDNDFDEPREGGGGGGDSEEDDYFTLLQKRKAAEESAKRDPNVAAISLVGKQQSSGSTASGSSKYGGGSVKAASVTPTKPMPVFPAAQASPTISTPAAASASSLKESADASTLATAASTDTSTAPPPPSSSVKKPSTARSEDNNNNDYDDEGFEGEETVLDKIPVREDDDDEEENTANFKPTYSKLDSISRKSTQFEEDLDEDGGFYANKKKAAVAVEPKGSSPSTKTTSSPVKSSNASNNKNRSRDEEEEPLDTGYGEEEFDEYDVSFEA